MHPKTRQSSKLRRQRNHNLHASMSAATDNLACRHRGKSMETRTHHHHHHHRRRRRWNTELAHSLDVRHPTIAHEPKSCRQDSPARLQAAIDINPPRSVGRCHSDHTDE
ncbi:hypothetical protein M758_2G074600, partial [Ceratodon purpureus]